jgi:HK97 family phage prohead protease
MPVVKEREYRELAQPLVARKREEKSDEPSYIVEGYATTFDKPYVLFEDVDGTKYYEVIDRHALDNADMSDVIMQYDHNGRVFARNSNNTLQLDLDGTGFKVTADLSRTELAKGLYEDIAAGMITKMSWAFVVTKDAYDQKTRTRTVLEVKKVYDVSAVSIPANDDTMIAARNYVNGRRELEQREQLAKRVAKLKIDTLGI